MISRFPATAFSALALAAALSGCLEGGSPPASATIVEPVRSLAWGIRTDLDGERESALETDAEWRAFWREHDAEASAPAVDFSKERVAAVALGVRGNGCFGVRIVSAHTTGASTIVNVTERVPGPDDFCTQAIVTPFHFVAIPKRDGTTIAFAWSVGTFEVPEAEAPSNPSEGDPAAPAWRPVAAGQHSAIEDARRVVLATEAEYAALWDAHGAYAEPRPARPDVDFSKERVAAAFLGPKPNACWHADVDDVARAGNAIVVSLVIVKPSPAQACADAITHPFVLVAIPQGGENVEWKETERSS